MVSTKVGGNGKLVRCRHHEAAESALCRRGRQRPPGGAAALGAAGWAVDSGAANGETGDEAAEEAAAEADIPGIDGAFGAEDEAKEDPTDIHDDEQELLEKIPLPGNLKKEQKN